MLERANQDIRLKFVSLVFSLPFSLSLLFLIVPDIRLLLSAYSVPCIPSQPLPSPGERVQTPS